LLAIGRTTGDPTYYNQAINEFNQAATLTPEDPMPLLYISRAHAAVGEFARAIQYAVRAVELSPADAFLYGNLGTMYYRNREYDKAVEPLRLAVRGGQASTGEIVAGTPLDYGRAAEYYYLYGLALARTGQCSEAIQISQQLQKGVANDEVAVYNAQEMINICQETGGKLPTITPQPTSQVTPTP
jgi:tetratricopeptide (TPR) repeat protein